MVKLDPILLGKLYNKSNGMDKTDKVISEVREIFTKGTQCQIHLQVQISGIA